MYKQEIYTSAVTFCTVKVVKIARAAHVTRGRQNIVEWFPYRYNYSNTNAAITREQSDTENSVGPNL